MNREVVEEGKLMIEAILAEDALFTLGAKLVKKSVDSLIAQGFTRGEAILIVSNNGPLIKGNS